MCGIAGIKANIKDRERCLRRTMSSLVHRGPDNRGEYFDGDIALGHSRLKIIDLTSQGNQPMANESSNVWMVCNAEISNFKELRQGLEYRGHRFRSSSDNEVILHGYEEWGISCLDKLRGMFAFCLWDANKRELFLARDRFGIKPLYYYYKNGVFIFASEVRAILASGLVTKSLSLKGLETYLNYGGLKEPLTIIEDIYSLMPSHYIVLDESEFKISRYWDLLDTKIPKSYLRTEDMLEQINSLLKESIKLNLLSDMPIGIFLSGGIDSSSLVSLAAQITPKLKTVSIVFSEEKFSEIEYSRLVAKKYNTQHHEISITDKDLLENLVFCLQSMDEPTFNGINTYFISKVAKEAGLSVALSGLGGDELFCGYPTFKRAMRLEAFRSFWIKLPDSFRGISSATFKALFPDTSPNRKIAELLKRGVLNHPYFWMRMLFTEEERQHLLNRSISPAQEEPSQIPATAIKELDIINQISYLEMTNYMVDILLRDTDSMSMAHSLEVRVPFIDHKLIELMLSIPGRYKLDRHMPKPFLVRSLRGALPEKIFQRPKMGFVLPFDCWLRGYLRQEIEETLLSEDRILGQILNNRSVLDIWNGFLIHKVSWQRPWALYVLKRWVNSYLG